MLGSLPLSVLACLAPVLAPAPQGVLPEGRAGDVARAFFEAFNAADEASMRGYFEDYRTPEALERFAETWGGMQELQAAAGELTPVRASSVDATLLKVEARSAKLETPLLFTLELQADPPQRLVNLEVRPGSLEDALAVPERWTTLAELAEAVRAEAGVPALAVATLEAGRITETAVVGRRSALDETATARADDRFHVGSITKSMTASMIGRLVEDGVLRWDVTLGEALEGLDIWPEYAGCTLLQVLQHRAGLPDHLLFDDAELGRLNGLPGTPTEQRAAYVAEVLGTEPEDVGGFRYSNAGYSVAAQVAERATGRAWEDLVQEHVFDALRLSSAGIGWPATPERPDQPRGHFRAGDTLRPQGLEEYPLGAFMHPAGDVHLSVRDLARYALAHLNGLVGREDFLRPETVRRLHEPLPGSPYACGWLVRNGVHAHNGSAGTFHALVEIDPEHDRGFVVMTNTSDFGDSIGGAIRDALRLRRGGGGG